MIKRLKKIKKEEETPKEEPVVIEVKENMPQLVYGPPSFFRKKTGEIIPEKNEVEGVYGPPVDTTSSEPTTVYEKVPSPLYGPPPVFRQGLRDFSPEDNDPEEVYGPPEDEDFEILETEFNRVPEVIYGPPSAFGFNDDGDDDDLC